MCKCKRCGFILQFVEKKPLDSKKKSSRAVHPLLAQIALHLIVYKYTLLHCGHSQKSLRLSVIFSTFLHCGHSHLLHSHLNNINELSLLCNPTTLAFLVLICYLQGLVVRLWLFCMNDMHCSQWEPPSWRLSDWFLQCQHQQGRWWCAPAWKLPPHIRTPPIPDTQLEDVFNLTKPFTSSLAISGKLSSLSTIPAQSSRVRPSLPGRDNLWH